MSSERDLDVFYRTANIVVGAGKMLEVGGRIVGHLYQTQQGQFHLFDDSGRRLDVFSTEADAEKFARWYWKPDGTVDPSFKPIRLQ